MKITLTCPFHSLHSSHSSHSPHSPHPSHPLHPLCLFFLNVDHFLDPGLHILHRLQLVFPEKFANHVLQLECIKFSMQLLDYNNNSKLIYIYALLPIPSNKDLHQCRCHHPQSSRLLPLLFQHGEKNLNLKSVNKISDYSDILTTRYHVYADSTQQ